MVEAEVVDSSTDTNGFPHTEPIIEKLNTVGEEKKVLLRQTHYNNTNSSSISNGTMTTSSTTSNDVPPRQQRNNAIFSNPMNRHSNRCRTNSALRPPHSSGRAAGTTIGRGSRRCHIIRPIWLIIIITVEEGTGMITIARRSSVKQTSTSEACITT